MDFHHAKHTLMAFQASPQKMREGAIPMWNPGLNAHPFKSECWNVLVFVSIQKACIGSKGAKFYSIYELPEGWHRNQDAMSVPLQKKLVENETDWDDEFDESIPELFKTDFQREVFRSLIMATPSFKGLQVEVREDLTVVFTAPW
eukprot:gnl/MRDRNA2_/MRDRNA2_288778_c0_seq1.p1 gnl/MRDRNA2_/MRDRNA2_288778_c0~~gnl/MRDRNA2_/MRDRNA2_288778_c0_seq1.p1  ORF type:complete len:145 (-),score=30.95 gnl/MRDRNA2_/MRDRNA2_288778_c0_seq1:143-577(-)